MNTITAKTVLTGLIGDPVSASVSPAMQNAAFAALGLDYIYLSLRVAEGDLTAAVNGLRAVRARGFNVTMPHKMAVMALLDNLDKTAEDIGAVNTVVNDNGVLRGYNTDGEGFLRSLRESGIEPGGKNIVVLGAGGASRSISYTLVKNGGSVTILNRDAAKAAELAEYLKTTLGSAVRHGNLLAGSLEANLARADILINTTSVGMKPDTNNSLVPAELLRPDLAVCDVLYSPEGTKLIRDARAAGARTVDGTGMVVWQGVLGFELWTGQTPPVAVMRSAVLKELGW